MALSHKGHKMFINEENNEPMFRYNPSAFGGTEYMAKTVLKNIIPNLPKFRKYNCYVAPGVFEEFKNNKESIVWLHNNLDEFGKENQVFLDFLFSDKVKYIIAVSETQKQNFIKDFNISEEKIYVIPNAIYPINPNLSKFSNPDKIEIIHMSTYSRGMGVLLKSLELIDEKNITIRIFNDFYPDVIGNEKAVSDPRVIFYGKTPKSTVMNYLSNAHIHAYPSMYNETFGLVQAEALSAGCLNIYSSTEKSSLKEISDKFGLFVEPDKDLSKFIESYANQLSNGIELLKKNKFNPDDQIKYINSKYSWEAAIKNWEKLHELL